jgi:hypothetical protein
MVACQLAIDGANRYAIWRKPRGPFASFLLRLRTLGPLDPLPAGAALATLTSG